MPAFVEFGDDRLPARFWEKVYPEPNTGCWLWGGAGFPVRLRNGEVVAYGAYRHEGRIRRAHVVAGEVFGVRVVGLDLRHRCHNRPCVNPGHLGAGTRAQNMADASSAGRTRNQFSYATHCVNGHPFDEANTYWRPAGGRGCRSCRAAASRRHKRRVA